MIKESTDWPIAACIDGSRGKNEVEGEGDSPTGSKKRKFQRMELLGVELACVAVRSNSCIVEH